MAAMGNIIYADSYIDLLAIDISDLNDIKIVKRVENAFPNNYGYYRIDQPLIVDYVQAESVELTDGDCSGNFQQFRWFDDTFALRSDVAFSSESLASFTNF